MESRRYFFDAWGNLEKEHGTANVSLGEKPRVWKTIGDEILYVKLLTDHRQLCSTLSCWMKAVQQLRSFVKSKDSRLDVKSTAWTAGFPLKNKEVVVSSASDHEDDADGNFFVASARLLDKYYSNTELSKTVEIDYVGPSIDIGFRISNQSSSRRFAISADIAYILSLTTPHPPLLPEIRLWYSESIPLKGVFGGVEYPIFWIDMSSPGDLARDEDNLSGARPQARDAIQRYCESFYSTYDGYTHKPFILHTDEQQIPTAPDWYNEKLNELVKNYQADIEDAAEAGEDAILVQDGDSKRIDDQADKVVKDLKQ